MDMDVTVCNVEDPPSPQEKPDIKDPIPKRPDKEFD